MRLSDVVGMNRSKRELQTLIERLRETETFPDTEKGAPRSVLLVGPPMKERKMLAEVVAGEIGCPLLSLSFSGLIAILSTYHTFTVERLNKKGSGFSAGSPRISPYGIHVAEELLHKYFSLAQRRSPCILFIEDIDAIARMPSRESREQVLKLLDAEMDAFCKNNRHGIVLASALQTQYLDHVFYRHLRSGYFLYRVLVDHETRIRLATRPPLCPSCNQVTAPNWKHCAYCGASLVKLCPRCGTLQPDLEDVRFCFSCGYTLD